MPGLYGGRRRRRDGISKEIHLQSRAKEKGEERTLLNNLVEKRRMVRYLSKAPHQICNENEPQYRNTNKCDYFL